MKYLDEWNQKRKRIADKYSQSFNEVGDLILPAIKEENKSAHHLYVVRTKYRDELYDYLNSNGIETIIHYPIPIHLQESYSELQLTSGSFPITELLANEILSVPIHPHLTNQDLRYIINSMKKYFD